MEEGRGVLEGGVAGRIGGANYAFAVEALSAWAHLDDDIVCVDADDSAERRGTGGSLDASWVGEAVDGLMVELLRMESWRRVETT